MNIYTFNSSCQFIVYSSQILSLKKITTGPESKETERPQTSTLQPQKQVFQKNYSQESWEVAVLPQTHG